MGKEIRLVDFIDEEGSELRFHKTLYFLYGIYYKERKEELYKNAYFQAGKYGPVEYNYRYYNKEFCEIKINKETIYFLSPIIKKIKKFPTGLLVELSHLTEPGIELNGSFEVMELKNLHKYFKEKEFEELIKIFDEKVE